MASIPANQDKPHVTSITYSILSPGFFLNI